MNRWQRLGVGALVMLAFGGCSPIDEVRGRDVIQSHAALGGTDAASSVVGPTWTSVASMKEARYGFPLVTLPDGRALAIGGWRYVAGTYVSIASAEIYDPKTNTWSSAGTTRLGSYPPGLVAFVLKTGKVLVLESDDSALQGDLFDPKTGTWAPAAPMAMPRRLRFSTILLPSGKVLAFGGFFGPLGPKEGPIGTSEVYDPETDKWTVGGSISPRYDARAVVLSGGKVLAVGGIDRCVRAMHIFCYPTTSAAVYDPATDTWTDAGFASQSAPVLVALPGDRALAIGGTSFGSFASFTGYATVDRYDGATGKWSTAPCLNYARWNHRAIALPSGGVLVVGGRSRGGGPTTSPPRSTTPPSTPGARARTGTFGPLRFSRSSRAGTC